MKKILFILGIIISFTTPVWSLSNNTIQAGETPLSWECILFCNETSGTVDTVIIGEAPDARDGPPADGYDVAKPPTPIAPYVRAFLKDNLPSPYSTLWKDYRLYPDSSKMWNLSIQWAPEDSESPSDITITWNPSVFEVCEYTTVTLCTNTGAFLKNMLTGNTYTFSCPAYVLQNFKIIGQRENTPPELPSIPAGQTMGYHATNYPYITSGVDPDGDELYYQFDWGDTTQSSWVGPYSTGQAIQVSYVWHNPGSYLIKARCKDSSGQQSSWSESLSVVMQNRAPDQPTNPLPQNAATNARVTENLTWTGSDPDGDTLTYDVYCGTTNPPQKLVDNQSTAIFHPGILSYQTTYYWQIISWDGFGMSAHSPIWSFTTVSAGDGSEPPQNNTNHTNQEPIADASLSEQQGFMGSFLVFNGSRSYDPDGYITKWSWDFGDGTTSVGERTTHVYQRVGRFEVSLTVTDNEGATATDMISVHVVSANLPPSKPVMNGTRIGSKNIFYTFTISSMDAENDFLQYTISWGDGSENTSMFLPNETTWSVSHSWDGSGKYHLTAEATDNITISEKASLNVYIDVLFVRDLGFLYDTNNDGSFDSLYLNSTGKITTILKTSDGAYYLDTDDDGKWDQLYNPNNGSLTAVPTGVTTIEDPLFFIIIIAVAVMIIAGIVYLYKKNYI